MKEKRLILLLIILFCAISIPAQTANNTQSDLLLQHADDALALRNYAEAARLYEQILSDHKDSGEAWFKLGQCYQEQGEDQKALDAYEHAVKNRFPETALYYRKARLFAKTNQRDQAFELLNKIAALGFSNIDRLKNEPDLARLQSDQRFADVIKKMDQNAHPCEGPGFHDFDFWVGEWNVTGAGSPTGLSSVQKILNNCVILENYSGLSGYAGKSFNSYDPQKRTWTQYWIDNSGSSIEFHGRYADGQLVYESDSVDHEGKKTHREMTFVKLTDGRVRQFSVQSEDDGKTWTPEYDLLYTRKK